MIAVATKPTPIEVLERVVATLHFEAEHDDNPATWVECDGFACADAHEALGQVEAVVKALGEVLPRLQYNHEELLIGTSLEHKIGSDADCSGCIAYNSGQAALAPFQVQP